MTQIASLEAMRPWVWQLKLSENEFTEIEKAINAQTTEMLNSDQTWARALLVYIAEWYKRRYQSGSSCPLLVERPDISLEAVWKTSGFAWKRLVYSDEGGSQRWLYSAYVLGGLAICHEQGRNDKLKFLKALCRIYHHEDFTLENLVDEQRAVSFRQSVKRHSLHDYMQEILNGNLPFHREDLADPNSEVNRFILAMRTANDEVMHDKFRLEWVITNAPGYRTMGRALRLWLCPEEVRGGLHQYLRYDRMSLWEIMHPEKLQSLKVGVRFLHNGNPVSDVDWDHTPITFHNTGDAETGFIAIGITEHATCRNVPAASFDTILVVARDNEGREYELQREAAPDILQLWRVSGSPDEWSSRQSAQRDTAVVFSPDWHIHLDSTSDPVESKPFRSKRHGLSEAWGWYIIYDKVTLSRGEEELTLYNRQGYDRIATHLYLDTIQYVDGGYVKWVDDEDELLPLIFGSNDIIVRHFATKDDITNANPEDDTEIELIEYKQTNGHYAAWTVDNQPPYGKVKLRITVKSRLLPFEACFLPRLNGEQPIVRDFENCAIRYATYDGFQVNEQVYQDEIPLNNERLTPTVTLPFGNTEVNVYRPTLIKEIYLDGQIINYLDDGEELNLPYIFKNRVEIADYSRQGYRRYQCSNFATIYDQRFINIEGNPSSGMAALAAWENGIRYPATLFDEMALDFLFVTFGNTKDDISIIGERYLFWDYSHAHDPVQVTFDNESARNSWGIIFHDLLLEKNLNCRFPLMNDNDTWADEFDNISELDCFLQAVEHEVYFFIFMPLRKLSKSDFETKLYKPLVELRGGNLTDEDLHGLHRFAEEFQIDLSRIL